MPVRTLALILLSYRLLVVFLRLLCFPSFCQLVYVVARRIVVAASSADDGHGRWTAAAQLKLEDHVAALASSEKALSLAIPADPRRVKALYRKGDAQLGLGRVAEAKDTLTMAYRLDSTNKQVSDLLKRIIKAQVRQKRWRRHLWSTRPSSRDQMPRLLKRMVYQAVG